MAEFNKEEYKNHLYALIICGGAGTRLWPRSVQKSPKQFLEKFYGEKTLFQQTVERAKLLTSSDKIYVITLADYADEILQQSQEILAKNIITEPFGKNTAMAVGVGAAFIRKNDPDGIVLNFWSDAVIENDALFIESINLAAKVASLGDKLAVVGLKPTFPHTGLGYIETGEPMQEVPGAFRVTSFKEKPDLATAESFLAKGNYYWNTGIYIWSVKAVFEAFSKYSPQLYSLMDKIFNSIGTSEERAVINQTYQEAESISIDVAVSEKADNLSLIPATFPWSDIGDWKVAFDLKKKDENGNVIEAFGKEGWHLGVDTKNCLIESQNRLIATVGVSDLVIIETEESVLVCSGKNAQDVKKIVNTLKEQKKDKYL